MMSPHNNLLGGEYIVKRKRIRKIVLISILALFIITSLYKLSIEPSDYNKAISKQIEKANTLVEKANLGNDKGDYSKNTVIQMKDNIAEAENIIEKESPDIDELRKQYNKIKNDIKVFKDSYNKNSLSKEEVKKIKKDNKLFTEKIDLGANTKIEWCISEDNIKDVESINLDIEKDTVYEESIKELAKDNNMDISILSFRHNDELPGKIDLSLYTSLENGKKHLYKYNEFSNRLIYRSELKAQNNIARFKVEQGGDWILSDKKIEVAKLESNKTINEEKDSKKYEQKKDKDKDEKDEENPSETAEEKDNKKETSENKENNFNSTTQSNNKSSNSSSSNTNTTKKDEENYCYIEIRCDTILKNMDRLPQGKEKYIPKDGVILPKTKVKVKEGENVFDILKRVTRSKGIQMEFRNDPLYSGAYVEGINHLYEFDGGELSGWMYKVNGWFPEYGCSRYLVNSGTNRDRPGKTNGEVISWVYTCNLGKDVGDQDYWKYDND